MRFGRTVLCVVSLGACTGECRRYGNDHYDDSSYASYYSYTPRYECLEPLSDPRTYAQHTDALCGSGPPPYSPIWYRCVRASGASLDVIEEFDAVPLERSYFDTRSGEPVAVLLVNPSPDDLTYCGGQAHMAWFGERIDDCLWIENYPECPSS